MFSNLWTLWNVKDVSYGQRRCSHFRRGWTFSKIHNVVELSMRGINYEACDLEVCSMFKSCSKIHLSNIRVLDYMKFLCSIGTSQGSYTLPKLFHCKPFHHSKIHGLTWLVTFAYSLVCNWCYGLITCWFFVHGLLSVQ
jgi:hypothetical protein